MADIEGALSTVIITPGDEAPLLAVPSISVTSSMVIITDNDSDAVADPGDTLRTTVTITNTSTSPITGITLGDTLTGSTLTGTVNVSPLTANDSYTAVGNTLLLAGGATGSGPALTNAAKLTANDTDFLGDTLTVDTGTIASAQGGSVTINADGSFSYISAAGFTGADTFTYTIRDKGLDGTAGNADDLTSTATVTITVSDQVWYVDAAAGNDTTGTGTSANPFATVTKAATLDGASDYIYVKGSATGTLAMEQGERLIGTGSALVVGGNTLAAAGTRSTITGSSGFTVSLAGSGTGNNEISGINVFATGGAANSGIFGNAFGTLTVNNATIDASGTALSLDTVTVAGGGFVSTDSDGGGINVRLSAISGTLNLGTGALSGASSNTVFIAGGTGSIDYNGSITHTGLAVGILVGDKTGGTVQLDGAVSSTGQSEGILLTNNTGAAINFTGALTINTSAIGTSAFIATGGGTVSASGSGSTINSGTGTAVIITNATIGTGGVTFQSVSTSYAANGIVLNTTGAGAFSVTGGGTIEFSSGTGINLPATTDWTLAAPSVHIGEIGGSGSYQVTGGFQKMTVRPARADHLRRLDGCCEPCQPVRSCRHPDLWPGSGRDRLAGHRHQCRRTHSAGRRRQCRARRLVRARQRQARRG